MLSWLNKNKSSDILHNLEVGLFNCGDCYSSKARTNLWVLMPMALVCVNYIGVMACLNTFGCLVDFKNTVKHVYVLAVSIFCASAFREFLSIHHKTLNCS